MTSECPTCGFSLKLDNGNCPKRYNHIAGQPEPEGVRAVGDDTDNPIPPDGCICASFWTVRRAHKPDCPLVPNTNKTASPEAEVQISPNTAERIEAAIEFANPNTPPEFWRKQRAREQIAEIVGQEREAAKAEELQWLLDNHRQFYWDGPNGAEPNANILKRRLSGCLKDMAS